LSKHIFHQFFYRHICIYIWPNENSIGVKFSHVTCNSVKTYISSVFLSAYRCIIIIHLAKWKFNWSKNFLLLILKTDIEGVQIGHIFNQVGLSEILDFGHTILFFTLFSRFYDNACYFIKSRNIFNILRIEKSLTNCVKDAIFSYIEIFQILSIMLCLQKFSKTHSRLKFGYTGRQN
jgi:hypothetical protein